MVSRRLLRIKILQICYAYFKSDTQSINQSEKELFFSIQKTYDLYHYLILLMIDTARYADSRIDLASQKRMPTKEDLNPNRKFVENKLLQQFDNNLALKKYLANQKLSWVNYPELIKGLYLEIRNSELYAAYMSSTTSSYTEDKKFISDVYSQIIINFEPLYQNLEEQSIYWNDDVDFVINMILKSFRSFKANSDEEVELMPLFKNDEDIDFTKRLFRKVVLNYKDYESLISGFIQNWDVERIAFLDNVIMCLAIAELTEFSDIPTKVSLDEYIEIAKFYSTQKSNIFINGILDKIVDHLKKEGKIAKTGRGLIGEM
ncbi:MAG: transcription antitermination factor NusB [Bacteroidetes bacterium GWF2_33_16]|nr:MAG: transcription antitermination factor NusB [Bacteroidetes bacterium GWE2_32_14]OFY05885.1 MAG: transcription antitermination factor NusB [Bacteroidetes bacterium GWF2_33_16]